MLEWKVALLVAVPVVAVPVVAPVVAAVSTQHRRGQVLVPAVGLVTSAAVAAKPTEEKYSVNQTLKKRTL